MFPKPTNTWLPDVLFFLVGARFSMHVIFIIFALWATVSIMMALVTTEDVSVSAPTVLALRKISFLLALIFLAMSFFSEIQYV